jgi:hypothetical protein
MSDTATIDPIAQLIDDLGKTTHPLKQRLAVINAADAILSGMGYEHYALDLKSFACDLDDAIYSEENEHPGHNRWGQPYPKKEQQQFYRAVASLMTAAEHGR